MQRTATATNGLWSAYSSCLKFLELSTAADTYSTAAIYTRH